MQPLLWNSSVATCSSQNRSQTSSLNHPLPTSLTLSLAFRQFYSCVCVCVRIFCIVMLEPFLMSTLCVSFSLNCWWHFPSWCTLCVLYYTCSVLQSWSQLVELQSRRFTNFHYYCYYSTQQTHWHLTLHPRFWHWKWNLWLWAVLFVLLCSKAVEFSPFWHCHI